MIFTLCIERPRTDLYEVVVSLSGTTVWKFTGKKLATILRQCTSQPIEDIPHFLVWYEQVCAGTVDSSEIRANPEMFANRIHALQA